MDKFSSFKIERCLRFVDGTQVFHIDKRNGNNGSVLEVRIYKTSGRLRVVHNEMSCFELSLNSVLLVKIRDRRILLLTSNDGRSGCRLRFPTLVEHQAFFDMVRNYAPVEHVADGSSQSFDSPQSTQRFSQFSSSSGSQQSFNSSLGVGSYSSKAAQNSPALKTAEAGDSLSQSYDRTRLTPRFARVNSSGDNQQSFNSIMDLKGAGLNLSGRNSPAFKAFEVNPSSDNRQSFNSIMDIKGPDLKLSEQNSPALKTFQERREQHRRSWKRTDMSFPAPREQAKRPATSTDMFRAPDITVLGDRGPQFSLSSETRESRHAMFRAFQYIRMDPAYDELLNIVAPVQQL